MLIRNGQTIGMSAEVENVVVIQFTSVIILMTDFVSYRTAINRSDANQFHPPLFLVCVFVAASMIVTMRKHETNAHKGNLSIELVQRFEKK